MKRPFLFVFLFAAAFAAPAAGLADTPDAYLDYVESTGTQWIDTGVNGETGLKFVADLAWDTSHNGRADWMLVGARKATASSDNTRIVPVYIERAVCFGHGKFVRTTTPAVLGVRHEIVADFTAPSASTLLYRDGTPINSYEGTYAPSTGNVDAERNLYVFACNWGGTANYFAKAKLYGLTIFRKDASTGEFETLRRFLPCLKDGIAALYDKEHGEIYYPQGGDLVAGPVLPRPAELVEWVQSDGAGGDRQLYIDTGIVAKNDMSMIAELEWVEKPTVQSTFCGASNTVGFLNLYTSGGTHQYGYSSASAVQIQGGGNATTAGVRFRIVSSLVRTAQSLEAWALDGSGYYGQRTGTSREWVNLETPLYLFARNDAGTPNQFAHVRLYAVSLTNELGVVRDFLPCVADNGQAGLYDTISERIFFPQAAADGATAEFSLATEVGAVTNHPATTKWPIKRPEWIAANGTNDYVNLDVIARDGTRMLAEVEWNDLPAAATFCGAATNSSSGLFSNYRITTGDGSNYHRMGYYNGSSTLGGGNCAPAAGVRYRVETSLDAGNQVITVKKSENGAWVPVGNGTRTVNLTFPAGFANLGIPIYLFARNFNGRPDEFAPARLYSFKLWQDGKLVRDLVPAFHPADNAPCLFDKISQRYFRDDGGYRLTAGGAITPFPQREMLIIMR